MQVTERAFAQWARERFVVAVTVTLIAFGCSGTSGMSSGCTLLQPLPSGRYMGPKNDNAVNLRLSPNGINYLNNNWQTLVSSFAPNQTLSFPIPCTSQPLSLSVISGTVYIADQGNAAGTGRMDGVCNSNDLPATVTAQITGFAIVPQSPDKLTITVRLNIDTGKIYAVFPGTLCDLKCSLRFNTGKNAPVDNQVAATIKFSIDTKWDKLLGVSVDPIVGTEICGASGAMQPPSCLDANDIDLAGEGGVCGVLACDVVGWDPVMRFILQQISPLLQRQIKSAVAAQTCQSCAAGQPACPNYPGANSTCDAEVCKDSADVSKCVPRFLGVEGRVAVGALLGAFGAPPDAQLDLSIAAGGSVKADTGLTIGTRGGFQAVATAPCVAPSPAPPMAVVPAPDFDAEATPGSQHHVGLGLSSSYLNLAFHQAHQAGALCVQIGSNTASIINSGLFKTFLPSLGRLATRDGKDVPMIVALRPGKPPEVKVGKGTYDPVTKKPILPLLTLELKELSIDFYALLDDRYARLFTLTIDVALPVSLIFEGCDKVTPALGSLSMLVTNLQTANSEMLAEDPKVLEDLIPAVIGLAEPAVAAALTPFALPALGAFKLKVNEVKGVGLITGSSTNYNHLAIYAQLLPATASCAVTSPSTTASLLRGRMPLATQMRLTGKGIPWPVAELSVAATGKDGTPEFTYRIDDGLWSDFVPAPGGVLEISHPRFLLQGEHTISVRSRVAEDPHGVSQPVEVGFLVDWEPPEVTVRVDEAANRLWVTARDVVSPAASLKYAYALNGEEFGAFGPAREISLSAAEARGGVSVRVKDLLGNVGEVTWRSPTVALHDDNAPTTGGAPQPQPVSGCSAVSPVGLGAVALALAALRRRRSN